MKGIWKNLTYTIPLNSKTIRYKISVKKNLDLIL